MEKLQKTILRKTRNREAAAISRKAKLLREEELQQTNKLLKEEQVWLQFFIHMYPLCTEQLVFSSQLDTWLEMLLN